MPCTDKERHREYMREWQKKNPDKVRAYRAARRAKDPEGFLASARARDRKYRANNPDKVRMCGHRLRKKIYGILPEQFEALLLDQKGLCAICACALVVDAPVGTANSACVDHCHVTGCIRGLLCRKCNIGIGHLQESPQVLRSALQYLARSENG